MLARSFLPRLKGRGLIEARAAVVMAKEVHRPSPKRCEEEGSRVLPSRAFRANAWKRHGACEPKMPPACRQAGGIQIGPASEYLDPSYGSLIGSAPRVLDHGLDSLGFAVGVIPERIGGRHAAGDRAPKTRILRHGWPDNKER